MSNAIKEKMIAIPSSINKPPTDSKEICSVPILADAPVIAISLTQVR